MPFVDHFYSDLDNVSKLFQHKGVVNWGTCQAASNKRVTEGCINQIIREEKFTMETIVVNIAS